MLSLQEAIDDLYRIAVVESKATSTLRLQKLADYCVEQLAARGLPDTETEVQIPGAGRDKKWDLVRVDAQPTGFSFGTASAVLDHWHD